MNRRNFLLTVLGIGAIAKAFKPKEQEIRAAELLHFAPKDLKNGFYNGHRFNKSFFRADGVNVRIPSNLNEFNYKTDWHKWKPR